MSTGTGFLRISDRDTTLFEPGFAFDEKLMMRSTVCMNTNRCRKYHFAQVKSMKLSTSSIFLLGKQSPNEDLTKSNIIGTSVMARHLFASFSPRHRPDWEPVLHVLVLFAFKPDRAYQLMPCPATPGTGRRKDRFGADRKPLAPSPPMLH